LAICGAILLGVGARSALTTARKHAALERVRAATSSFVDAAQAVRYAPAGARCSSVPAGAGERVEDLHARADEAAKEYEQLAGDDDPELVMLSQAVLNAEFARQDRELACLKADQPTGSTGTRDPFAR